MDTMTPRTDAVLHNAPKHPLLDGKITLISPAPQLLELCGTLERELTAAQAELAAATGPGTVYARLKLICDYAVEKLGHDSLRSDKAPEQTVIETIESQRAELSAERKRVATVLSEMFTPQTAADIMKRIDDSEESKP